MCTTAAPASAASMAEVAICSGVTGTCGLRPTVSPAPVMAQVMKAFQFNGSLPSSRFDPGHVRDCPRSSAGWRRHRTRGGPDAETAGGADSVALRATNADGGTDRPGHRRHPTVLLGIDLDDPAGCLGFAIHRTDHTEGEAYWLRGLKVFPSIVPNPAAGMDFSLRAHPLQGFQWGDYSAKPDHDYTYRVVALGGTPAALVDTAETTVRVSTEPEDDGAHGIWFNRGVAGSQAFVKRFGQYTPPPDAGGGPPGIRLAVAWSG